MDGQWFKEPIVSYNLTSYGYICVLKIELISDLLIVIKSVLLIFFFKQKMYIFGMFNLLWLKITMMDNMFM